MNLDCSLIEKYIPFGFNYFLKVGFCITFSLFNILSHVDLFVE